VTRQVFTAIIRKRKSPACSRPKKRRQVVSRGQVMLTRNDFVHLECNPEGLTMNQHLCVELRKRVRIADCRQRTKKGESSAWPLPAYNNVQAHTTHSVQATRRVRKIAKSDY